MASGQRRRNSACFFLPHPPIGGKQHPAQAHAGTRGWRSWAVLRRAAAAVGEPHLPPWDAVFTPPSAAASIRPRRYHHQPLAAGAPGRMPRLCPSAAIRQMRTRSTVGQKLQLVLFITRALLPAAAISVPHALHRTAAPISRTLAPLSPIERLAETRHHGRRRRPTALDTITFSAGGPQPYLSRPSTPAVLSVLAVQHSFRMPLRPGRRARSGRTEGSGRRGGGNRWQAW